MSYKLRVAQIAAYRNFEARLGDYGIAPRYLGLLGVIKANPGQPQSRLAEAVALKRSSLVPILDKLEAAGLVERRVAPDDRRYNAVWLTEEGTRTVKSLLTLARRQEAQMTKGLDVRQREQLLTVLDQIIANLTKAHTASHERSVSLKSA